MHSEQETIRVVIRIKPVSREDLSAHRSVQVDSAQPNTLVVEACNKRQFFTFDHVAGQTASQNQIFQQLGRPLVHSGYNGCVFAYGQTGAGKTHSILGAEFETPLADERGLLPRVLEMLYQPHEQYQVKDLSCSYLEIYNEQINDLLRKDGKGLLIREDARKSVYVEGLSEERARNYDQALDLIRRGLKNRKVAFTDMNSESSRSHTVFTIMLRVAKEGPDRLPQELNSKLHVVDLAGSERQKSTNVEGERLKEGCNINKSLTVLGTVINSLVESQKNKKHIPYRDSKLTFFLRDSLGGSAITRLLACINPSEKYIFQTLSTLKFAKRAKVLRIRAEKNEVTNVSMDHLRTQLRKTKIELSEARMQILELKSAAPSRPEPARTQLMPCSPGGEGLLVQDTLRTLEVLEKNELHYRAMLAVKVDKQQFNKRLQQLLKNGPAFSRIFGQNLRLKEEIKELRRRQEALQELQSSNRQLQRQLEEQRGHDSTSLQEENRSLREANEGLLATMRDLERDYNTEIGQLEYMNDELKHKSKEHVAQMEELVEEIEKRNQAISQLNEYASQLSNEVQILKLNNLELAEEVESRPVQREEEGRFLEELLEEVHRLQEQLQAKARPDQLAIEQVFSIDLFEEKADCLSTRYSKFKEEEEREEVGFNTEQVLRADFGCTFSPEQSEASCAAIMLAHDEGCNTQINALCQAESSTESPNYSAIGCNTFTELVEANCGTESQVKVDTGVQSERDGQMVALQSQLGQMREQLSEMQEANESLTQTLADIRIDQMARMQEDNEVLKGHASKDRGELAERERLEEELQTLRVEMQCLQQNFENERAKSKRLKDRLKKQEDEKYSSMVRSSTEDR